ncbi:MAG: hypothetical protein RIC95_13040 [Vicingaceae bacterium]
MKRFTRLALLFMLGATVFTACKDDDDDSVNNDNGGTTITPNEEELITTVAVIYSDTMGMAMDTFYFRDPDGDGGNSPEIDTLHLPANAVFDINLQFLDESDPNDVEDITAEIQMEDDEHFVCFEDQAGLAISIELRDSDGTYPVGLSSRWTSMGATQGQLKLSLKHQPGVKDGTCAPGDTDVEVDFPYVLN